MDAHTLGYEPTANVTVAQELLILLGRALYSRNKPRLVKLDHAS